MINEKLQSIIAGAIYASVIGIIVFLYIFLDVFYLVLTLVFSFFSAFFLVLPSSYIKPRRFPDAISYFLTGALLMGVSLIVVKQIIEGGTISSVLCASIGIMFFFGTYFLLNSIFRG